MTETAQQTTLPELPEGWRAHLPEPDRDDAQVWADGWSVCMDREGYTSLEVHLTTPAYEHAASVSIASVFGCADPADYVLGAYEQLQERILYLADDPRRVPTTDHVRLALDWCRAALEATS